MGRGTKIIRDIIGAKAYYSARDGVLGAFSVFKNENYPYRIIKQNKDLKNTHVGERCFILGNGPSLKKINLKSLADEFIFTCNYFNLVDDYQDAKTNFHLWMDLNLFGMRPEVKSDPEMVKKCFSDISKEAPMCFIPAVAYPFVKKQELDKLLNIRYIYARRPIRNTGIYNIDLTKSVYSCSTVVQYAVQIAIYMGFSEIYLLGCDSTNIITQLNSILGQQSEGLHAYSSGKDNTEKAVKELMNSWNTNRFLNDHYILFRGYELLNEYCDNNGIKLMNCSDPTLITEIKRISFDEII